MYLKQLRLIYSAGGGDPFIYRISPAPASAVLTYMSIQKKYLSDLKFENVDLQTFLELYMSIIFNFHEKKKSP
jgi:hypothetical protein